MKIQQINEHQLELHQNGLGSLIVSIVAIMVGLGILFSMLIVAPGPWWTSLAGLLFIGVGSVGALGASRTDSVLRNDGTSEVSKTSVLTKKSSRLTFEPHQVRFVGLETRTENDQASQDTTPTRRRISTLFIALDDNSQVPIATKRNSGGSSINGISLEGLGKAPLSNEAKQIAAFYGVQVNSTSTGDMGIEQLAQAAGTFAQTLMQSKAPDQPLSTVQKISPESAPVVIASDPALPTQGAQSAIQTPPLTPPAPTVVLPGLQRPAVQATPPSEYPPQSAQSPHTPSFAPGSSDPTKPN